MKTKTVKTIICMAAVSMLTATGGFTALASDINITQDNDTGDTDVDALVASQGPSYTITVPSSIDFGTLHIPSVDADDNVEQTFGIKVSNVHNLAAGQYIAVRVSDPASQKDFKLSYHSDSGKTLPYDMQTTSGSSIKENNWEAAGGYQLFTTNKDTDKPTYQLVLNQKELFGKDNTWSGAYEGKLTFYAGLVNTP